MILASEPCRWLQPGLACTVALALLFAIPPAVVSETLSLAKSGPKTAREGDLIEYRLDLVNQGTASIDGIQVRDTLPAEVDFVQALSTAGGMYDPASGIWTVPALGTGEEDKAAELTVQALVRNGLVAEPSQVVVAVNRAEVVAPQPPEPVEAEFATSILCGFCIDWEILSIELGSDYRVDPPDHPFEMRFFLHVQVANNGPVASEGTVTLLHFSVSGGRFSPPLALAPAVPVPVSLAAGETQTVNFSTDWAEGPFSSYTLYWEFEVSDLSLLDPVTPNTAAGSFFGDVDDDVPSGGGCFIATAAYGSYLDPHVRSLRRFRDETLLRTRLGRTLVAWYYQVSPPVAHYIERSETLRTITRMVLTPAVLAVEAPLLACAALCGILLPAFALRRHMRHARRP